MLNKYIQQLNSLHIYWIHNYLSTKTYEQMKNNLVAHMHPFAYVPIGISFPLPNSPLNNKSFFQFFFKCNKYLFKSKGK